MKCAIEKTDSAAYINSLYALPEMAKLRHDNCIEVFIDHPSVEYQMATINGEPVGAFLLIHMSPVDIEVHSLLTKKATRGSRILSKLVLDYCFSKGVRRVSTCLLDGFQTMMNHLAKLGFYYEGCKRSAYTVDGQEKDAWMYGLLRFHWEHKRKYIGEQK